MDDLISRQVAQHKINALIDEFETIMKDIRERNVDDSVCGLCEYDGAFMSDSGSWCNECHGFERDDCFKLKDQYREEWAGAIKNLPSIQSERLTDDDFETIRIHLNAYKEKLCNQQRWEEAEEYQRIIDRFMTFAYAQPDHNAEVSKMEIIHCKDCLYKKICSWKNQGAKFCSFGERGDSE